MIGSDGSVAVLHQERIGTFECGKSQAQACDAEHLFIIAIKQ